MGRQHSPYDVFVDLSAEGFDCVLGGPGTAEARIAPLKIADELINSGSGPLGPGLRGRGEE